MKIRLISGMRLCTQMLRLSLLCSAHPMKVMAEVLRRNRRADEVMKLLAAAEQAAIEPALVAGHGKPATENA